MTGERPPAGGRGQNQLIGVVGASVQAQNLYGDVIFASHTRPPAQLRAAPAFFTDRRKELADLGGLLKPVTECGAPPRKAVISGLGAVGKTALALQWGNSVRAEFADGQFFIDLRGFSADRSGPLEPATALARFLRALGIHPDHVPDDVEEQAARWRSEIAGRRVLIVADNAASIEQVDPLLPGSAPGVVVVTTRHRHLGLDGAQEVHLDALDQASSITLLTHLIGAARAHTEPDAVGALAARSGRLPLSLRVLGAHLGNHPHRCVQALVDALDEQRTTHLEETMDEETTGALDEVYRELPEGEQAIYRLVGDLPGIDVAAATVAELASINLDDALRRLGGLAAVDLVERSSTDRFRLHDRIRPHAQATAAASLTPAALHAQRRRVAAWFRDTAAFAQLAIIPYRWYLAEIFDGPIRKEFSREEALEWMEAEKPNLLAVQKMAIELEAFEIACDLVEAGWGLFVYRKDFDWWRRCCDAGYQAAVAAGDQRAMARAQEGYGAAYQHRHEWIKAEVYFRSALTLEEGADHLVGAATAFEGIGICQRELGNHDRALAYFRRALGYHLAQDRPRGARLQWRHIGETYLAADRPAEVFNALDRAREFTFDGDEDYLVSRELRLEANTHRKTGDLAGAKDIATRRLELVQRIRATHEEADCHVALADLAREQADRDQELTHLTAACVIYDRHGAPQADGLRERLRRLAHEPGE